MFVYVCVYTHSSMLLGYDVNGILIRDRGQTSLKARK